MTLRLFSAAPVLVCSALASTLALATLSGCGDSHNLNSPVIVDALTPPTYLAEIRRTEHGIAHIKANDEGSLGFGVAQAYAQDNFCLMANEFVTVNGERSKFFGPGERIPVLGGASLTSLQTDYFYRLINDNESVAAQWQQQPPEARALIEGYVAGYNRYLADTGAANLAADCRGAAWVRPITKDDMTRLLRRYAAEGGAAQFVAGIVGAAPPGVAPAAQAPSAAQFNPMSPKYWSDLHAQTGSNGVALGKDATDNGRGLLLGNPHFPWAGALRFYQLHLTIPGKLDAMGASLGGMPVVNIGFNRDLAWTHTVNTSAHFTMQLLQLDPLDPTKYVVDGKTQAMVKRTITLDVKAADGSIVKQSHDFYSTPMGLMAVVPGLLDWSSQGAYALRDANLGNYRMLEQWSAMNRATTIEGLRDAVDRIVGLPWVNTIATDKAGNALYMDVTVVPNVSRARQAMCVPPPFRPLAAAGLFVLSGATSACQWETDPAAPQPGIFAGTSLPRLLRTDYVQNSNDSAWLSNPAQPLTGFADIISQEGFPLRGRTRLGITQIRQRLAGSDGLAGTRMSMSQLQTIAQSNRLYMADQIGNDLMTICAGPKAATAADGSAVDLSVPCARLASWDRSANLDANIGLVYFMGVFDRVMSLPNAWAVPYNLLDPVNTPRGLNVADPAIASAVRTALASSVRDAQAQGWTSATLWGQIQGVTRAGKRIAIHGAADDYGVYNAIDSVLLPGGLRDVVHGTSYLQTVGFDDNGPVAQAVLTYSQSTDPASPWFADQTELFSKKTWLTQPFTEQQIVSAPGYKTTTVRQK